MNGNRGSTMFNFIVAYFRESSPHDDAINGFQVDVRFDIGSGHDRAK
jgi:hypothetical protein